MKSFKWSIGLVLVLFASCTSKENQQQIVHINTPAAENSETPNLIEGVDGNLYLSWLETKGQTAILKYAQWETAAWSKPEIITQGEDWFVNWADYPAMAVNSVGDRVAHYLQMSDTGTYTYDIKVVAKKAGAATWSEPVKLHSDTTKAEHGFVSMVVMEDDNFFLTWLDGRNTVAINGQGHSHDAHESRGAMTLRGAVLSPDLTISKEVELDGRVCDCCQTSAARTEQGPVVVYRDRSMNEVRDIFKVRAVGGVWTTPAVVHSDNWEIVGCPVNGPRIVAEGKQVAVAWFTGAGDEPKVNVAFSNDSGETFGQPVRLDEGNTIGRVDIIMLNRKTILVSWMEGNNIVAAKVNSSGEILKRYQLASSSDSRSSGFPQIALISNTNQVMIAWTDTTIKKIRTAILEL